MNKSQIRYEDRVSKSRIVCFVAVACAGKLGQAKNSSFQKPSRSSLVCPKLYFCKQLSLVVDKKDQRTAKMAIKISLAFRSF